ncbi:hypothetical protein AGMMS50239_14150 [Bacteroidia bacterium]|nr:hypothetical protein AGMMS50239_14150 [Bacteroidia bacterium]
MKNIGKYIVLLFLFMTFWSCKEEELGPSVISDDSSVATAFDIWLNDNYVKPYNIKVYYKLKDIQTNRDYNVIPADPAKSWALAKVVKFLWAGTVDEYSGSDFLKMYSFREFQMEGTYEYNANTIILATASGGIKIVFCGVNNLRLNDLTNADYMVQTYIKTMYHEYTHILNQKKVVDATYGNISGSDYLGDDWTTRNTATANSLGFVSPYAGHSPGEDFAELTSIYITFGQNNWDNILKNAGTAGAAKLSEKLDIATTYFKNSWDIDINEFRKLFEQRKADLINLDVNI